MVYLLSGISFSLKYKEGNTALFDNKDEPGGRYAQWNKQVIERQMLLWVYLCVEPKTVKLMEEESSVVVAGEW